jgi:hypothetical protein
MISETDMRRSNGFTDVPLREVKHDMGEITRDVVTLAELQAELFRLDAREAAARLMAPLVLIGSAAAVALGTVPVVLACIAEALVAAGLPNWLAFLIASLLGGIAAASAGLAGWKMARTPFQSFRRSSDELRRNIEWLKRTLAQQSVTEP